MIDRPDLPASLAAVIRQHADVRPDAPALTFGERVLSYRELDQRSTKLANALMDVGVQEQDRIAILSHNSPVFFELLFAASKANAVMVGLNWRLARPEIETILQDAEPMVLLVEPELEELLSPAARQACGRVLYLDDPRGGFEEFVETGRDTDPMIPLTGGDIACMLYTSGTTGQPKGVQLTQRNMAHSAWISGIPYDVSDRSVNLVAMPLFHVGGIGYGLSAFFHGGHTVLLKEPDAAAIVSSIEEHGITLMFLVPAVLQMVLDVAGIDASDTSSLELVVYGAAPISDAVLRRALDVLGCGFMQAYGMTETAGTIVVLPQDDHDPGGPRAGLLRSVGRALPWIELRVVDPSTGTDVAVGEVGEIWTRSEQNTVGYRNRPSETEQAITNDGWLRTGDAAYQDADGYLFLFDRFKDMIVSGGENVYPAEVENVLSDHAAVDEVAVFGIPDERWGETVKALVVLKAGHSVPANELIAFSKTRLAGYKCPTSVDFTEAIPRNASGKILKKDLRAPYWEGRDRQIG